MRIVCVIPARLGSTRFPRKMLAPLGGKPLVQWAYEAAKESACFDQVVVAVDGEELFSTVKSFGGEPILTSPECRNGTERLVELQRRNLLEGDVWVCWQGDEPFVREETICTLLQSVEEPEEEIWTLKRKIFKSDEIHSPHVVKVVCDVKGRALYFSRSLIPNSLNAKEIIYKHVGIYAYSDSALKKIATLSPAPLEEAERLEQLRFLYHGMSIRVHETSEEIIGIDTKEELDFCSRNLKNFHNAKVPRVERS